jgi:ribonuclease-3
MHPSDASTLENRLGYVFRAPEGLRQALTHPSRRHEMALAGQIVEDNQRLEFLGDAALGLLAANALYRSFPACPEGELTRLRSGLTSTQALAAVARELGLGETVLLGKGEDSSGGRTRESNLADTLEAVLGAAWLDGGWPALHTIFERVFAPRLEELAAVGAEGNPKGALQEIAQRDHGRPPDYVTVEESGPAHARHFVVEVRVEGVPCGRGEGPSKRAAEHAAARAALAAREPPTGAD